MGLKGTRKERVQLTLNFFEEAFEKDLQEWEGKNPGELGLRNPKVLMKHLWDQGYKVSLLTILSYMLEIHLEDHPSRSYKDHHFVTPRDGLFQLDSFPYCFTDSPHNKYRLKITEKKELKIHMARKNLADQNTEEIRNLFRKMERHNLQPIDGPLVLISLSALSELVRRAHL